MEGGGRAGGGWEMNAKAGGSKLQTEPELTPKIPGPVASADLFDLHCAAYDTESVQLQEYRSSASIHAVGL